MLCHYTNVKEKKRKGRKETRRKDRQHNQDIVKEKWCWKVSKFS